jgi:hypothetical protein
MSADRQLRLIIAIWTLSLLAAAWGGATLPSSDLVAFAPQRFDYLFPSFALLVPPVLVATNHVVPTKWRWHSVEFGWVQRVIDRRWGEGTTLTFWRRFRPLSFFSAYTFILGVGGMIASTIQNAPPASFEHSLTFVCFGVGFFLAFVLERHVFKVPYAA